MSLQPVLFLKPKPAAVLTTYIHSVIKRPLTRLVEMPSKRELKWQKAAIGRLADDDTLTQTPSNVNKAVFERVRKCFARANHANANENGQRAAFKMAHQIMQQ